MKNGGKRPGAGRKKGSISKKKKEILIKAAEMGVEPILYSIEAVNCAIEQARAETEPDKKMSLYKLMHDMNADLLAYFHRKMPTAIEQKDTTAETLEDEVKRREAEVIAAKALINAKK